MNIQLSRRKFITGVGLALAAPAIVQASSLMPVRAVNLRPVGIIYDIKYDIERRAWIFTGTKKIHGTDWVASNLVSVENLCDDYVCLEVTMSVLKKVVCLEEGWPKYCPQAAVDHSKVIIEQAIARREEILAS